jgi:FKBP-type peptidyl-prolyl cis-trans isomerase FklB
MQSTLFRFTLFLLILGLTSNAWGLERKAEWAQYSRSKPLIERIVAAPAKLKLTTNIEKISYSIGMSIGEDINSRNIKIDADTLARGIADVIRGAGLSLTKEQAMQVLAKLQEQMNKKQLEAAAQAAFENLQAGQTFLAKNAEKPGVTVTKSGLQYEILNVGTGAIPTGEDFVVVDYRGLFIDGQEFDSSYSRGEPAEFSVYAIIPGWTEALLMMKEGAKWRITLPADLAYGTQGAPPIIEPNTTLIFEVELKSIQK